MAALASGALPPHDREELDPQTLVREGLMLGLRTSEGVDLPSLALRAGIDPRAGRSAQIHRAVERGNLHDSGDRLLIPPARWLLADDIVATVF
jgi:coproporphyrinogen III oxidase-like Fe-S oxidoreductase